MFRRDTALPRFRVTVFPALTSLCVAALLSLPPAGCGGGKSTPGTNSYPEACSKSIYVPNYADGDGTGMNLAKWKSFPVRVYFDPNSGVYTSALQTRAETALDGWVSQTGGKINYTVVSSESAADIVVRFLPTSAALLSNREAVGITYTEDETDHTGLPYDRSYLASAEVYIGIDGDTFRENGTMGHELGHALGIGGHSPTATDLMYHVGSKIRSQIPTTPDVNTLRTAYCDSFPQAATAESRAVVPPSRRGNLRVIE